MAFAIVEVENKDNWTFFLQLLDSLIGEAVKDKPFVIMTNRQKVIFLATYFYLMLHCTLCCFYFLLISYRPFLVPF